AVARPRPEPCGAGHPGAGGADRRDTGGRASQPRPHHRRRPRHLRRLPQTPRPGGQVNGHTLRRLRRVRWAVRLTLAFGVAASVGANILHANPNPISQTIAAWPPLALLLTIELVSRVPIHRRSLAVLRVLATVVISGIAAWVSYWHMAGVATRYGETGASPYLLPISVDGLIVVASISLVELAGRIRHAETTHTQAAVEPARSSTVVHPVPAVIVPDPSKIVPTPGDDQPRTIADPAPLPVELLDRARALVAEHRATTGREMTRDELRAALRIQNATAGELLRRIRTETPPSEAASTSRRGPIRPIGALTR